MTKAPQPPMLTKDLSSAIDGRQTGLDSTKYAYKLMAVGVGQGGYGMDVAFQGEPDINEADMSFVLPFASGARRDGVGDLLEISGISTERHRRNPVILYDHGKVITLPFGKAEDRVTGEYTVVIDPMANVATAKVFVYDGKGISGVDKTTEHDHATFCEQLFDLIAKKYVRAGSIGYQVIQAQPLPADPNTGTPAGLHLIRTLMLEASAVVLPANADTVRKVLALPSVCGKALSPWLVKSLQPYAPERKAMANGIGGGEKAAIPVPLGNLPDTQIPHSKWKPGAGAIKDIRKKYRKKHQTKAFGKRELEQVVSGVVGLPPMSIDERPYSWVTGVWALQDGQNVESQVRSALASSGWNNVVVMKRPNIHGGPARSELLVRLEKGFFEKRDAADDKIYKLGIMPTRSSSAGLEFRTPDEAMRAYNVYVDFGIPVKTVNPTTLWVGGKGMTAKPVQKSIKSIRVKYRNKLVKGYANVELKFDTSKLTTDQLDAFAKDMMQAGFGKPSGGRWTEGENAKLLSPMKKACFTADLEPGKAVHEALAKAHAVAAKHGAKWLGNAAESKAEPQPTQTSQPTNGQKAISGEQIAAMVRQRDEKERQAKKEREKEEEQKEQRRQLSLKLRGKDVKAVSNQTAAYNRQVLEELRRSKPDHAEALNAYGSSNGMWDAVNYFRTQRMSPQQAAEKLAAMPIKSLKEKGNKTMAAKTKSALKYRKKDAETAAVDAVEGAGAAEDVPVEPEAVEDDAPVEKPGAEVLRKIHEHHRILMADYDEALQVMENEKVKAHLEAILEDIEAKLQETEDLFNDEYPDSEPLEGAGEGGTDDDSDEADSGEEDLPPPDEVVEAMEDGDGNGGEGEKSLKGKRFKGTTRFVRKHFQKHGKSSGQSCPECGYHLNKPGDIAGGEAACPNCNWEGLESELKSLSKRKSVCSSCGADNGYEPTPDGIPGPDQNAGDSGEKTFVKQLTQDDVGVIGGASGFLKEASEYAGDWGDEMKTKAGGWHKQLDPLGLSEAAQGETPVPVDVQGVEEPTGGMETKTVHEQQAKDLARLTSTIGKLTQVLNGRH